MTLYWNTKRPKIGKKGAPKVGDIIEYGFLPCEECGQAHHETVLEVRDGEVLRSSWASEKGHGHAYRMISQSRAIQALAEDNRRLREAANSAHDTLDFLAVETDDDCMEGCAPEQRLTMAKISKIATKAANELWDSFNGKNHE